MMIEFDKPVLLVCPFTKRPNGCPYERDLGKGQSHVGQIVQCIAPAWGITLVMPAQAGIRNFSIVSCRFPLRLHAGLSGNPLFLSIMSSEAHYVIQASFSQKRMIYIPASDCSDGAAKVIYNAKDGKSSKTYEALDWLTQLVSHIPNRGESRRWREFVIMATIRINREG